MAKSLKEQTITGMIWSSVHRFGTIIISFGANVVLARLLTPEDFGIIGMLMVFIVIANTLIDGGFASALIQKKTPNKEDYSTIFWWNLVMSSGLFLVLYFSAPLVAGFYNMPLLTIVLQVQGIILIFNGISIIQSNILVKQLDFKKIARVNIIATITGAAVGIMMAIYGFGVWSLVGKTLVISLLQGVLFWFGSKWRPLMVFSWKSFKELFSFSSYMVLTSILFKLYENIQILIIGRVFSARELGYFIQAQKLEHVPIRSLSAVVNQVTFPVFSEIQDDLKRLKTVVRKSIKSIVYLNFPLMIMLCVIAEPLILLLFGEKWLESVPLFQILCIGGMFWTINTANSNIFKSLGRSDIYFKVQFIKVFVGLISIFVGLQFGLYGLVIAISGNLYIFFAINTIYSNRLLNYSFKDQFSDIIGYYILSLICAGLVYLIGLYFSVGNLSTILIQSSIFVFLFLGLSWKFKLEAFKIYHEIVMTRAKRILDSNKHND